MNQFYPKNQHEWREWLEEHHLSESCIWLIFRKKSSPNPNLSWSEAVDEALCFGWIDSTKKTLDSESYIQFFCKRKPKSTWSKVNKDKVEVLVKNGLIAEAGIQAIEVAKENGSWTILDEVEKGIIPEDLFDAFRQTPGAESYFMGLSKSAKKSLLYWIQMAKRPETRKKRVDEVAQKAAEQKKPTQFS